MSATIFIILLKTAETGDLNTVTATEVSISLMQRGIKLVSSELQDFLTLN